MKKKILYRLLAFAALFAAGAAFVFAVGTFRYLAVNTYPVTSLYDGGYSCELAIVGDRAAEQCGIEADSELYIDDEFDVDLITEWLTENRPEKLVIFFECTPSGKLNERLDAMSLLLSYAVGSCENVYVMSAPPPLEAECTSDFRPLYVRQNNHALEDIAERYGAGYIDEHTVRLADMTGAVADEYVGKDAYFSPEGARLVRDVINEYV